MKIRIVDSYRALKEMADGLQDIKRELRSHSDQIRQNLMMIFLFGGSTTHHWIGEIYGNCHKVSKCRNNNKFPRKDIILQELFGYWQDCYEEHLSHYVKEIERKENRKVEPFNADSLYSFLKEFYSWFSQMLSDEGWVDFEDMEFMIQSLRSRYNR